MKPVVKRKDSEWNDVLGAKVEIGKKKKKRCMTFTKRKREGLKCDGNEKCKEIYMALKG